MNDSVIRVEFKKFGGLKYISHLDLQRAVLRFIKRAQIPIRYTEGFNPHPKIVFALTMSVGMESECEMADVYISKSESGNPLITPDEFVLRLSRVLPHGLEIVRAYLPEKKFSDIESAEYTITLYKKSQKDLSPVISEILSHSIEVVKKAKSGEKTVDIKPLVKYMEILSDDAEKCILKSVFSAKQNEYLNPDLFVKGLIDYGCSDCIDSWQVVRCAINFKEI